MSLFKQASAIVILLVSSALAFAGEGAYKWADAKGNVHYGERPPEGVNAEYIKTITGKSGKASASSAKKSAEGPKLASSDKNKAGGAIEALPNKDPQKCEAARGNLELLNGYPRIRQKDAEGNYHYLTEEEKAEQRQRAQSNIDVFCN